MFKITAFTGRCQLRTEKMQGITREYPPNHGPGRGRIEKQGQRGLLLDIRSGLEKFKLELYIDSARFFTYSSDP